jgi:hypothetical protein
MVGSQLIGMNGSFVLDQNIVVFLNIRIKSVLDSVFWSSGQSFTDLGPFGAKLGVKFNNFVILSLRPLFTLD